MSPPLGNSERLWSTTTIAPSLSVLRLSASSSPSLAWPEPRARVHYYARIMSPVRINLSVRRTDHEPTQADMLSPKEQRVQENS